MSSKEHSSADAEADKHPLDPQALQAVRGLFQEYDTDKDGKISGMQLQELMLKRGISLSDAEFVLQQAGVQKNALLDYNSFASVLQLRSVAPVVSPLIRGESAESSSGIDVTSATKSLLCGGIAGAVSRTMVAPLERLKIIFQTQGHPPAYTGVWQGLVKITKEEGFKGYFRGNNTNIIRIFPTSAIQYFSYEQYKSQLTKLNPNRDLTPYERLLAGSMAGITALIMTYPLDFIRARLTVQSEKIYRGITHALVSVVKSEGMLGLYKGLWPSILGVVPYVGIDFAVYDTLKRVMPRRENNTIHPVHALGCGAIAGSIGQTVAYPLDLIRRRLQVQDFSGSKQLKSEHYAGMSDAFVKIYKNEGLKGFYRGLWPNYLKVVPSIAVSFVVYDNLKHVMNIQEKSR